MAKEIKTSTIIYSVLLIAAVFLLVVGILVYGLGIRDKFTRLITRIIPYPAATIGGISYISVNDFGKNLDSVKMFYENQDFSDIGMRVDFKTTDGQKRLKIKEKNLLNKMIENEIIKKLAEKRGIKITAEMASQEVERKINDYGNREDVLKNLKNLYNWDIMDFEKKIVQPDLYKEALEKSVKSSEKDMADSRKKITEALNALKNKESFADTAQKYSDGESAKNGGELGWLTSDQMIPEIAVTAALIPKGSTSDTIETPLGFHIINVEDKKTEDGIDKVRLSQIFVKSRNFSDWLLEQEKGFKIYIPLKDFYWDKETQSVQFTSQDLKNFENNLEKNSPDDASVLF